MIEQILFMVCAVVFGVSMGHAFRLYRAGDRGRDFTMLLVVAALAVVGVRYLWNAFG